MVKWQQPSAAAPITLLLLLLPATQRYLHPPTHTKAAAAAQGEGLHHAQHQQSEFKYTKTERSQALPGLLAHKGYKEHPKGVKGEGDTMLVRFRGHSQNEPRAQWNEFQFKL